MAKDSTPPAQLPLIKDRNIISRQEVKKALLPDSAHPVVKPLLSRLVSRQPGTEALLSLRQGVAYAAELLRSLKSARPQASEEKVQHTIRIRDTIHLLEGLCKSINKETRACSDDEPGQLCYLELTALLDSIKSSIQILEEMKFADAVNYKDSSQQ